MKIFRSRPDIEPSNQPYVEDIIPMYYIRDYNYRPVFEHIEDSLLIIEWDIAFHKDTLRRFIDRIHNSDHVHVAPYLFDNATRYCVFKEPGKVSLYHQEAYCCHTFGFGMTYIPNAIRAMALRELGDRITDGVFSQWHYEYVKPYAPVHWDCEPVHLNYNLEDLL